MPPGWYHIQFEAGSMLAASAGATPVGHVGGKLPPGVVSLASPIASVPIAPAVTAPEAFTQPPLVVVRSPAPLLQMAICELMSPCVGPVWLNCMSTPVAHTSNFGSPV